jgi:23S rRNA pseudouridine2605 synthase
VEGTPHGSVLDKLRQGVKLDDGMTAPAEVEYVDMNPDKKQTVLSITIHEGRNRQVRRMLEAVHFPVVRLKRVSYGPLELSGLARGKFRHLRLDEVSLLRESALSTQNIQKGE